MNDGSYNGCAEDCLELGPHCGDEEIQGDDGETCDDGNDVDGDGCNLDCLESGRQLWEYQWDGPDLQNRVHQVDFAADGSILARGLHLPNGPRWGVTRIDGDGAEVFNFEDDNDVRYGTQLVNLDDGEYIALFTDGEVVGYSDTQVQLWAFSDGGLNVANVASDPGANAVYISGSNSGEGYYQQRNLDGTFLWEDTSTANSCPEIEPVRDDGALVRCGMSVLRVDGLGDLQWELTVPGSSLSARSDGSFVTKEIGTVRNFDADGVEEWSYEIAAGFGVVAADDSGTTVIASTDGSGGVLVEKLTADGEMAWSTVATSPDTLEVEAIDVSEAGMIAVGGTVQVVDLSYEKWVSAFAP